MLPLWEGWDEYAHFAWLEHWNEKGTLPRYDTPVSREIEASLELTPLTEELKWLGPEHFTYAQWWALAPPERAGRTGRLANLRGEWRGFAPKGSLVFYEAQQPPLYYWLAAIPERLASGWPLRERVVLVRLLSLLLASAVIPLGWWAALSVVGEGGAAMCAALLAVAPGLAIDVSRVANDGLAIAVAAFILVALVRRWPGWILGLALGAGLLSKAYLLSLIPAVIWLRRKHALVPVALALGVAGWWYARNLALGYAVSGWLDRADPMALVAAVVHVNWLSALNITAKSFVWFGAWSFLTLKSWAYTLLELVSGLGFVSAVRRPRLSAVWAMAGFHLVAMSYGVLVYFGAHKIGNLPGWYLWPMAAPLALLLAAGLGRRTAVLIALLGIADVYGAAALMVPYYAGFVSRNRADASRVFEGLARLHVPAWLAVAWLSATAAVLAIAFYRSARSRYRMTPEMALLNPAI